jgi:hypothetical protein
VHVRVDTHLREREPDREIEGEGERQRGIQTERLRETGENEIAFFLSPSMREEGERKKGN